ncbi:hypothetical protein [Paenibacillus radicis (ex Xue et al. 2023)]|uniref:Uncharacterized protein n=1 Tax=Paenibacillus radicis (ex Xue et al. 2023) TaxID=2972489 RepID=A0ABT1YFK6_9BACL|nr:hypothetical protein [Paenibacillus radicis (ex Xue et al. 2023)]MCR8631956.1 hypothetical protein [Paenibacillus radicis (ex Xue et al. 2023)]
MSTNQAEKKKHLQMLYKNNVVVSMDGDRIIVVHSKRSLKPLVPFEVSKQVYGQWKQRDNRIEVTDKPLKELFDVDILGTNNQLTHITDFNEIEFSEE